MSNEHGGELDVIQTASGPVGKLAMPNVLATKPCFTCVYWSKDRKKLEQHLRANGLKPDADGCFVTPIVQDFDNRTSLKIDPRSYGFCKDQSMPSHMQCTCEHWRPTTRISEMQNKLR